MYIHTRTAYMYKHKRDYPSKYMHAFHSSATYKFNDAVVCVTWLSHMRDTTQSYVWHDHVTCTTYRVHTCDMTVTYTSNRVASDTLQHTATHCNALQHAATHCNTLIYDMTLTYRPLHQMCCSGSIICVKWFNHMRDTPQSYAWYTHIYICKYTFMYIYIYHFRVTPQPYAWYKCTYICKYAYIYIFVRICIYI